jgi:hypothetical protein
MADPINKIQFSNDYPIIGENIEVLFEFNEGFSMDDIQSIEYEWEMELDENKRAEEL